MCAAGNDLFKLLPMLAMEQCASCTGRARRKINVSSAPVFTAKIRYPKVLENRRPTVEPFAIGLVLKIAVTAVKEHFIRPVDKFGKCEIRPDNLM